MKIKPKVKKSTLWGKYIHISRTKKFDTSFIIDFLCFSFDGIKFLLVRINFIKVLTNKYVFNP